MTRPRAGSDHGRPFAARVVSALLNSAPAPIATRFASNGVAARTLRPLVNRMVGQGPAVVTVRSGPNAGLKLAIHPRTEKFYWTGLHEPWVQDALVTTLRPGMTFWDVGAHIGFMALLGSRLVGAGGAVRAFEPAEDNRARLLANARLNHVANLEVESCALGAVGRTAMLYAHGASSMRTLVAELGHGEGETVVCRTIDEVAAAAPPPDVIKIDVEGVELDVLRGGHGLFAAHHPTLVVEFSTPEFVEEARALLPDYAFALAGKNHWLLS